jgi:hypothetical protein
MKTRLSILFLMCAVVSSARGQNTPLVQAVPGGTAYLILSAGGEAARFEIPALKNGLRPEVSVTNAGEGWSRVRMTWRLDGPLAQDDLAVVFAVAGAPDFWWAPHLSPNAGDRIAQHVFRSPALITMSKANILAIVPDLDICGSDPKAPWYLDLDAPAKTLRLGLGKTKIVGHVQYHQAPGMELGPGLVQIGFFVAAYKDDRNPPNPWSRVTDFLWTRWARPLLAKGEPLTVPMDAYVRHTYDWAFRSWKDAIWQEPTIGGTRVGAPKFIANTTESPNFKGPMDQREFLSIWNQAWFSSLRSAIGVARFARRTKDDFLREKAELTKAFALAAPMKDGIFPSVYRTEMEEAKSGGVTVHRSKGWATGYWTNSDRTPREQGLSDAWYHVLDASWTALMMLRWNEEIAPDPRLIAYARQYAEKLLTLQDKQGFFPAWLDPQTLKPAAALANSPETAASATFLLQLARISGDKRYRAAALKAIDALLVEIVPGGRWEDFETYWSCSGWGRTEYLGRKIPRNAMYKKNTLSMFWTAEALLEAQRATKNDLYLRWGRRVLDELSMFQQAWQPPFIFIPALGGFGVMNFDGEWNDSRQSLFCELYLDYFKATGDAVLFERGVAALKAGFVMMYCPENPKAKPLWEKVWPFFGPQDYGFTMENYGHGGEVSAEGEGIGSFTIYDWGNGAAAEARNRVYDHYGDVYIDRVRGMAFGIDSVEVAVKGAGAALSDRTAIPRTVRVVFEDGTARSIRLEGRRSVNLSW